MVPHGQWVTVHCRTGSSENEMAALWFRYRVHCRTGSSENNKGDQPLTPEVHCRTGSSENFAQWGLM